MTAADNVVQSWCVGEIATWKARRLRFKSALAEYEHHNKTKSSFFLFRVKDRRVSILDKPNFSYREAMKRLETDVERLEQYHFDTINNVIWAVDIEAGRALLYRWFIQHAIATCPNIDTIIPFDVDDGGMPSKTAPIFVFQKKLGSNSLLFPDVDFLYTNFYRDGRPWDTIPYEQKRVSAVFSGSTTGGYTTGKDRSPIPRVKSALFFKGNPRIEFRLPVIVQASPEGEDLLKGMGFGAEDYLSWEDQYQHKFIISIDGNGATCSRVVMALGSNSVFMKYDSVHMLYYFKDMVPWRHYIPISSDQDVQKYVELEENNPGFFRLIADEGKNFWRTYLNRNQITNYAARILQEYTNSFDDSSYFGKTKSASLSNARPESWPMIEVGAHVGNYGDVSRASDTWIGDRGSGTYIEGVWVIPGLTAADGLEYSTILHNGTASSWAKDGEFCGTRGSSLPIKGLRVRLCGTAARDHRCSLSATFTDGSKVGPVEGDDVAYRAESEAPLEAFRLNVWRLPSPSSVSKDLAADPSPALEVAPPLVPVSDNAGGADSLAISWLLSRRENSTTDSAGLKPGTGKPSESHRSFFRRLFGRAKQ